MPVKIFRPLTPSTRYVTIASYADITKSKPEKSLVFTRKKTGGRNCYGRITSRGIGQGNKQKIRNVDFKRNKHGVEATVTAIEYDPRRTARLALLQYKDGEKRYIIAPQGLQVGSTLLSGDDVAPEIGNSLPIRNMPLGTNVHNIELQPGQGGKIVRSAGTSAQLNAKEDKYAVLKMPSGEIRKILITCYATVGVVSNGDHNLETAGKAGVNRWKGVRPRTRGVAMNPVDHPMGGGEGKASGGHPRSRTGKYAKGLKTRSRTKGSNKLIITRSNGKKL